MFRIHTFPRDYDVLNEKFPIYIIPGKVTFGPKFPITKKLHSRFHHSVRISTYVDVCWSSTIRIYHSHIRCTNK